MLVWGDRSRKKLVAANTSITLPYLTMPPGRCGMQAFFSAALEVQRVFRGAVARGQVRHTLVSEASTRQGSHENRRSV